MKPRVCSLAGSLLLPLVLLAGCGRSVPGGSAMQQAAPGAATLAGESRQAAVPLAAPAGAGSGEPHLAVGPSGEVVLSWLEPDGDSYRLNYSRLENGAWSSPSLVARGDDFFVNWADLPSVQPITADVWIAHWLELEPQGGEAYDIAIATSQDGGKTFSSGSRLNLPGVPAEHGFATLFAWGNEIGAVWLDGSGFEREPSEDGGLPPGTSLRYAKIAYDGTVGERGEIDALVCDCCRTGVASTPAGPLVIYRDRSPSEIRDVAVRRASNGSFSAPVTLGPDNWQIDGCPVNGPAIAARGKSVAAAWFTAAGNQAKIRFARSEDAGASFAAPIDVDGIGAYGQVGVVLLEDGAAVVSWWRRAAEGGTVLAARRVGADGRLGELRVVARSDAARPMDVPQMAMAAGGRLVFAWTDAVEGTIKTALLPVG